MRQPITIIPLLIAFTSITYGQQNPNRSTAPPQEQETLHVSTASVQVEAIVTDKSGRRINGLTASDFQLTDEAKPQSIDFFSVIEGSRVQRTENRGASSNAAATGNSVTTTTSPLVTPYRGRHIALIFDDLNLSAENFLRARRSFADYINNKLDANDLVAIISTGGSFASMQQFTNDKQRLLSALNRIAYQGSQSARATKTPFSMTVAEALRIDSGDTVALADVKRRVADEESAVPAGTIAEQTRGGRGGTKDTEISGGDSSLESRIRVAARAMVSQMSQATRANLRTLETLFHGMADLPGRKIVVLLTESLMTAGGTSEDVSNQIVQLIETARRVGVSVYALDAQGLNARNTTASEYTTGVALYSRSAISESSSSDFEKLGAARSLVAGTGGELISNTNDLASGLDRALEDSSTYYVLGFRPAVLDNKFHHLTVAIKDRSDLIVRTRRGYLAVNQETVAGTNTELAAALISPVPRIELPLEVVANAVPKDMEQIVIIGLHVGRNYLNLPDPAAADQVAAYDVLAWVFATGRDQPVGIIKRTVTFDLAKEPQDRVKLKSTGFVYVPAQPLTLPAGLYQVRAVVREKTSGAVGSAYQFFEVPDVAAKKVISMSSIVLTNAGQSGFSGHYSFKHGTDIQMAYIIYNLPKDISGFSQQVKLINSAGAVLMDSQLEISVTGATAGASQFPQGTQFPAPSQRGRYALIVSLHDAKSKVNVERRTDFVVE